MRRRTAPLVALALLAAFVLSGCGPVNAASGAIAAFTRHMEGQPGVVEASGAGSNTLPFTGSAGVSVVVEDGTDTATLTAILDRMAAFVRDYPYSVSFTMSAELDGFTLEVSTRDDVNADRVDLLGQVRAIDAVIGGEIGGGANLTLATGSDPIATLDELLQLDFASMVTVITEDGSVRISSTGDGTMPASELDAMKAIDAKYDILTAFIEPGSVELRLSSDRDVSGVEDLIASLPGVSRITFTITGGIVTREGDGSFVLVDPIIEQAVTVPDVVAIRAEPDVLGFTVSTVDAVVALEAILATAGADGVTVYYASADDVAPGFSLYGSEQRRALHIPVVAALVAAGYVQRVDVYADRLDIVGGEYDEARMAQLAAELKALLPVGSQVRLTNSVGGVNFTFISGESIGVDSDESYGEVDAEGFVEAWNGAP